MEAALLRAVGRQRLAVLCAVLAWSLFFPVYGMPEEQSCLEKCGSLRGDVTTMLGHGLVALPDVRLVFVEKDWARFETRTDVSGKYEIELPSGTYWAQVLKDGNCRVQRSDFRVSPGAHLRFDFVLVPCASDTSSAYHEEAIPGDPSEGRPEVRIAFGEHVSSRNFDIYKPFLPQHSDTPFRVTLTADRYTVRGQTITLDRKRMIFVARGNVEVSDGDKVEKVKTATLAFRRGLPMVKTSR